MELKVPPTDFDEFHRVELPRRLAQGNGQIAARDLHDAPPLAFQIPEIGAYTYVPFTDSVGIMPGASEAETVVEVGLGAWREFIHEYRTSFGLLYAGKLNFPRGNFDTLNRWEPGLRAMLTGRPIYDPATVDLNCMHGRPLDLRRRFALDEPSDRLRHFLRQTGYLVVKGVLSSSEIEQLRDEVARLSAQAVPGDRHSWWARDNTGQAVLCRLIYAGEKSALIAALNHDSRIRGLAAISGEHVVPVHDRFDGPSVVLKIPRAVEGLADLPWHVDCGLGLHPILCPSVLVGIQLEAGTPESGQLHMLAGSWRYSCRQRMEQPMDELRTVALDTEPGDCTVHFGHGLHAAPPPKGERGRRTLYFSFCDPVCLDVFAPGEGPNDVLFNTDAAVIKSVDEILQGS